MHSIWQQLIRTLSENHDKQQQIESLLRLTVQESCSGPQTFRKQRHSDWWQLWMWHTNPKRMRMVRNCASCSLGGVLVFLPPDVHLDLDRFNHHINLPNLKADVLLILAWSKPWGMNYLWAETLNWIWMWFWLKFWLWHTAVSLDESESEFVFFLTLTLYWLWLPNARTGEWFSNMPLAPASHLVRRWAKAQVPGKKSQHTQDSWNTYKQWQWHNFRIDATWNWPNMNFKSVWRKKAEPIQHPEGWGRHCYECEAFISGVSFKWLTLSRIVNPMILNPIGN